MRPVTAASDADGRAIGEITSVDSLFRSIAIDATDVFLDIGSGRGNLVLACAHLQPPPLLSCGIEILAPRHEMAQAAAVALDEQTQARIDLRCGDALTAAADDLRERATKVFVNNLLFDALTNAALMRAMSPTRAPSLKLIACTSPLADPATAAKALRAVGLVHDHTASVEANYTARATPLHIYRRCE